MNPTVEIGSGGVNVRVLDDATFDGPRGKAGPRLIVTAERWFAIQDGALVENALAARIVLANIGDAWREFPSAAMRQAAEDTCRKAGLIK